MKKKMRRPAALLAVVMLMVSMLSVGTFAEGETGETSAEVISEEETGDATEEAAAEEASSVSEEETGAETDAEEAQAASEEVLEEAAAAETEAETETASEEVIEEASDAEEAADAAALEETEASDEALAEDTDTTTTYTLTVGGNEYSYTSEYIVIDDDNKTISVSQFGTDAGYEIQAAINYIYNLSTTDDENAKENWTITVNSGTYVRFEILNGLNGLTIQAAEGATVTIPVLDGSTAQTLSGGGVYSEFTDSGGIELRGAGDVTIDGLTLVAGTVTTYGWTGSAITDCRYYNGSDTATDRTTNGLTIQNCTFTGNETIAGTTYMAVFISYSTEWAVENCSFDNWYSAVCWMNDNCRVVEVGITGNTFTNCDRAVDGYYGNGGSVVTSETKGTFAFTSNTVIGTEELYCKVLLCDQYATTTTEDHDVTGVATITGNTLENACMILFNMETNFDIDTLISTNSFGNNTYYALGSEAQNVITLTYSLESDEDQAGYWEVLKTSVISRVGNDWTDAELALIEAAVEEANASGSHTLTLDFSSLYTEKYWSDYVYTIMSNLKYGVRWVGTESDDDPTIEKAVTSESTLAEGDTASFSLTVSTPEYLYLYFEDDTVEEVTEEGSYVVTVHDEMDAALELDASSIKVSVNGVTLDTYRYTLVTSGLEDDCAFEISIDLVSLVEAGILTADENGAYPDVVITYSATVAENTAAGTYKNTTWVTYEAGGISEKSTVEIEVQEYLDIAVIKVWDDSDDTDGIRPDSVTVELYADGVSTGRTVTLTEEGGWTASFTDLPAYTFDTDGNAAEIVYTVAESDVDGYTASYSDLTGSIGEGYTVTVTNVHEVTEEEVPEEETPEEKTPEETLEEEESEDTEETPEEEETEDTEDTEETEKVEDTEETEEIEDDEDAEESEDAEDDEDAEEVEDVEATDTGDPGVMLWIAVLCAALASILIGKRKIAG